MPLISFPSFPHVQPGGLLATIVSGEPPPGWVNSPQQTRAGVEQAWDVLRSFFHQTAPWQHDVYAAIRDTYRGLG
jgi:hypothetical protein